MGERARTELLAGMVDRLATAAGRDLRSVVLYGPAARPGAAANELNLLVVLSDLSLSSVESIGAPVRWWLKTGHPVPRLFSPRFIAEAVDVFPIELLDLSAHRIVLYGDDFFADVRVHRESLRHQCERELREKLMRLQEGFLEASGHKRELERLLNASYATFVRVFRGAVHLLNGTAPRADDEVIARFCELAGLDRAPFVQIDALVRAGELGDPAVTVFARYYEQLAKAIEAIDRVAHAEKEHPDHE